MVVATSKHKVASDAGYYRRSLPQTIFRFRSDNPWLAMPAIMFVLIFFGIPLIFIVTYSLHNFLYGVMIAGWTFENYARVLGEGTYRNSLLASVVFVSAVSITTVLISIPFAYLVAFHVQPSKRKVFLALSALPFLTSYLARVISWMSILGGQGILNTLLLDLGIVSTPLSFLSLGRPAVFITFANLLSPLAFFTVYAALERIDTDCFGAAGDLGARASQILYRIVLPLSMSGLVSAFALVFLSMFGDYITPILVGGTDGVLFVNLLINQFGPSLQWGFGAAMAITMVIAASIFLGFLRWLVRRISLTESTRRQVTPGPVWLRLYAAGFLLFLYAPIFLLLLFACNSSDTVGLPITGLTAKWFLKVFADPGFMDALSKSLQVGLCSSAIATLLACSAALPLSRRKGVWRGVSVGIITLPLLMPPVILGLGLVLTLHAAGVERGLPTLIAGHTILSLPVAFLVILARLEGLSANQELAAMDLGATPLRAFARITVPQIYSALGAAFLLTLAFSLDEFILTFLITGHDVTVPLYVYSFIKYQMNPGVMAGASVILLLSTLFLISGGIVYSARRAQQATLSEERI